MLLLATSLMATARGQNPLVAHYNFDDPANTYTTSGTIFDVSGNAFNGTVINAALTHNPTGGVSGGSMNAVSSGTASFTTSYAASPVAADDFTLMFWVKAGAPSAFLDFGQINYSNGTSGQLRTTSGDRTFYYRHVVTSSNSFQFGPAGGATIVDNTGSGSVWKQVAFMADSATGQFGWYVDGGTPLFTAFPATNNPFTADTTVTGLRIGRSNQANSRTGQIDEVQLYERSLTQAEVQLLFANPGYGGTNFRAWDPAAASNSWTAAVDWQGLGTAAAPGVTGDPTSTSTDVAILKNYAFSGGLGIDMSAAGADGSLALGGISFNSASGPLRIGNSAADTTGTLRLNGGLVDSVANTILKVAGTSDLTIGDSSSGSGSQTMAVELTATANIVDVAAGRTLSIESAVTQSGGGSAIQKTGAGTLALSGANAFTGGATISSGTLEVASIVDSGTSNLGNSGGLALRGGTLRYTGSGAQSTTRDLSIEQAASTIDVSSGTGSITFNPAFGTLSADLTKAGPGTLVLDTGLFGTGGLNVAAGTLSLGAASNHSGPTAVASGGTLAIGHADALQASTLTAAVGANVSFAAAPGTTYSIAGLAGSGSLNATGNTLSIGATNASTAFLGGLTAGALTKQGSGTLVLTGTNALGSVTIAAGTLIAGSTAALGGGPVTLAGGALRLAEGATLTDNIQLTGSAFSATISVFSGIDYLVVGGGGGGGGGVSGVAYPAGGGGGQVLVGEGLQPTATTLSVTVGAAGTYGNALAGGSGGSSSLADLTASGGGGGGAAGAGRGGASGSGNAGGLNNGTTAAGGGGGQTAAGQQGIGSPRRGGHGGAGLTSAITGTELVYGFGGGGGAPPTTDAANLSLNGDGTSTNPRAGSGGGGRATSGPSTTTGIGADGVVIVRYAGAPVATGGSIDTGTVPGYTLHTFTSGSDNLVFNPIARTMAGTLSGSGGFTYDSFGTLTLAASNSYQGGTIVSTGTLVAGHSAALGSGAVTVNAGGRLRLDPGSVIANEVTDLGSGFFGGTLAFAGGGLARTSTAGGGTLGTLLAGSAGAATSLNPNIDWLAQTGNTASDIMRLTNTSGTAQVLSLGYAPGLAPTAAQDAYLGWFDPTSTSWVNAIDGNLGGTSSFFEGSWTAYLSANPGATPTSALGVYGHDPASNTVWAVVNHNSDFAVIVVPEPGTLALASLGLALAMANRRWRRRAAVGQLVALAALATMAAPQSAFAQRFYDGGTSQVWDSSTANWSLTTGGPYDQTWATGAAVFEGTGANVVVSGTIASISSIRFDVAGYTLSGGSLPFPTHNSPITANADTTISATITGAGGIRKEGTGTLVLSAANTYSGATFLGVVQSAADAGVLSIADVAALGTGTGLAGRINFVGNGTLRYTGSGAQAITTKDLISDLSSSSMTIDMSNATGSLTITPTAGTRNKPFTKSGPGTLIMNGAFSTSALITANGGTLILGADNSNTGATTIAAGATLRVGAGSTTGALGSGAISNAGTLVVNRSNALSMAQAISGAGSLVKEGAGTLTVTGNNSYSGGTTISAGVVEFASGGLGSSGTVSLSGGTLRWAAGNIQDVSNRLAPFDALASFDTNGNTVTLASALGGSSAGGLRKAGTGTLVLGATNTYAGRTFIDGGALEIADVGMLGNGTGNAGRINFTGAGTLRYTGATPGTIANRDLFSDLDNSSMTIDVSNALGSLTITPTDGTRRRPFTKMGPGTLTMNGAFVDGGNGTAPITANGGTLVLGANNSNTGATTIAAGATLRVGAGSTTGSLGSGAISNGGTLVVNRSNALTMAQAISGAGSLVKEGAGTLTLSGANTYGGGTQLTNGRLLVNGSLGTGTVTVGAGTTLGGSGTIAGTIAGSGTVSVGNSPGILTAASVDPAGGLGWEFEITGVAPSWATPTASINDVLRLTDATNPFAASLSGANAVNFLFALPDADPISAGTYTVGFFTDRATDFASDVANAAVEYWVLGEFGSLADRQQFNVGAGGSPVWYTRMAAYDSALSASLAVVPMTADFGSGNVAGFSTSVMVVPEPGTLALAGLGLAVAIATGLRHRRRRA